MKTVSQEFLEQWRNPSSKFAIRQIKYKRRYWDTDEFVYETDWQILEMHDFSQINSIAQQLDTIKLNEFKMSNITLELNNNDNQWLPYNAQGIF